MAKITRLKRQPKTKLKKKGKPGCFFFYFNDKLNELKEWLRFRHGMERYQVRNLDCEKLELDPDVDIKELERELRVYQKKERQRLNYLLEETMKVLNPNEEHD